MTSAMGQNELLLSLQMIVNCEEHLKHWKTKLSFRRTLINWTNGQAEVSWNSGRANASFCIWNMTAPYNSTGWGLTGSVAALQKRDWS